MTARRRALGRGLDDLSHASFTSLVEDLPVIGRAGEEAAEAPAETSMPAPSGGLHVAAVTSGKGGTGKSVLASNLGVLLAHPGPCTILDADLCLANIHLMYGLSPSRTAAHLVAGEASLDDALLEGPGGVRVIAGGSGIPEMAGLNAGRLKTLARALAPLESGGGWLVVDTPAGLDRQSLLFLLAADQVVVVTTEDITALTDAYAVIKTLLSHQPNTAVSVVVNQARTHEGALEAYHRVAHVCRRFLGREIELAGIVPADAAVERSVASRRPLVLSEPHAAAARAIAAVARRMPSAGSDRQAEGGFCSRFSRLVDAPLMPA